jgi:hypothetical protein
MAVQNLHEAAVVLKGAYEAIAKLLAETEPMQREGARRYAIFERNRPLEAMGTEADSVAHREAHGDWGQFYDAADELIELLKSVDKIAGEEDDRAGRDAA